MSRSLLAAALALLLAGSAAHADEAMDAVLLRVVRSNYESLHGCYRKQLARDRSKGGNLILRLTLGEHDSVGTVKVARDQLGDPEVAACVLGWVRGWTLRGASAAGAEPGSEVLLPLSFKAAPDQFAVRRDDVAGVATPGGEARVLLREENAGARLASLTLIEVRGRVSLPGREGVDQALFVLDGAGRLLGPRARRRPLRAGDAVWISTGTSASVEGTLSLLRAQTQTGLLKGSYPTKPTSAATQLVVPGARARPVRALSGALTVWPLLQGASLPDRRLYLGLLEAKAGAAVSEHQHRNQAEILYVTRGEAEVRCGKASQRVGPAEALYLPPGLPHTASISRALRAVQIFVPGGPEDRYLRK